MPEAIVRTNSRRSHYQGLDPVKSPSAKESTRTMVFEARLGGRLTAQVEFAGAVGGERTPVSLVRGGPVVTDALWLPCLIKGLEVEHVHTPLQHTAHGLLVEGLRVGGACLCRSIVGTT